MALILGAAVSTVNALLVTCVAVSSGRVAHVGSHGVCQSR